MEGTLTAIELHCRAAAGYRFAAYAAELWYVYYVRVSFNDYTLRFVGSHDNVMECISFFYSLR